MSSVNHPHSSVTSTTHTHKWRAWLTTVEPQSRAQAKAGQTWRYWHALWLNPIGKVGMLAVGLLIAMALLAPILPIADPLQQSLANRLQAPSWAHWFGTDHLGRDVFSRSIWGSRPTLLIVAIVLLVSAPIGTLIGTVAGIYGGWIDATLMRITDVVMAFPRLILALAIAAVLGADTTTAILAITLTTWTPYARIARAEAISIRQTEFIQAAQALGSSSTRLVWHHALPLCWPSAIVRAALDAPGIVLIVAGLGFLGLGVQPPTPEWGAMVADGRAQVFEAWWVATFPGLLILSAGISFNLLGDALRDTLESGGTV